MKTIIIAILLSTSISFSLDTLWTHPINIGGAHIEQAEFSQDESVIVLLSYNGIRGVSVETGNVIWSKKISSKIASMTKISNLNTFILNASLEEDSNTSGNYLIDAMTGEILESPFNNNFKVIFSYLSKDGTLFTDQTVEDFNTNSKDDDIAHTIIYNMDGNQIFNVRTGSEYHKTIITPDNRYLLVYKGLVSPGASGKMEGIEGVKKYDIETGELEHHFNPVDIIYGNVFDYVEISADGKYMLCSQRYDSTYIYNLNSNELIFKFKEGESINQLSTSYFNLELDLLVARIRTASFSSTEVNVYDIQSKEQIFQLTKFPEIELLPEVIAQNYLLSNSRGEQFLMQSMNWEPTSVNQVNGSDFSINPNPASESIIINYLIENPSTVILSINDILGNQIEIIDEGLKTPNNHEINYNLNDIPSGSYYITLHIDDAIFTKQFIKE